MKEKKKKKKKKQQKKEGFTRFCQPTRPHRLTSWSHQKQIEECYDHYY